MRRLINFLVFIILGTPVLNAQSASFSPELVLGDRSNAYQHFIEFNFSNSWSINNVSLYDSEYTSDNNNIFFIRNMLTYKLNNNFKFNAAFGIKNPGAFATLTSQYQYSASSFKLSYSIGSTYQNGFTLEQTLNLNYTPYLTAKINIYINLFVVINTNLKELDRGIQQLRIGIKKEKLKTGIAVNIDQFTKAKKTLENFGLFIKYDF